MFCPHCGKEVDGKNSSCPKCGGSIEQAQQTAESESSSEFSGGLGVVKNEEVIDSWSVLIRNANGKANKIFENTEDLLAKTEVPNVRIDKRKLSTSIIGSIFGAKRDFLIVTETGNRALRPYQMFIGSRDYGNNLDVCWYLTYRLSFKQKLSAFLRAIPLIGILLVPGGAEYLERGRKEVSKMDLFDEQDLRAYVTNAHHCLLEAVDKLMAELNQDTSQIDRKSRGFLGIS